MYLHIPCGDQDPDIARTGPQIVSGLYFRIRGPPRRNLSSPGVPAGKDGENSPANTVHSGKSAEEECAKGRSGREKERLSARRAGSFGGRGGFLLRGLPATFCPEAKNGGSLRGIRDAPASVRRKFFRRAGAIHAGNRKKAVLFPGRREWRRGRDSNPRGGINRLLP